MGLAKQISIQKLSFILHAKSISCNEIIKQPPSGSFRKRLLSSLLIFSKGFLFASLSLFLLKRHVKQEPEKPDALAG